jgi:hypothetical protein
MKRTGWMLATAGALLSGQAFAVGGLANVSIVDRDSGTTLETYYYRGEYWVAGRPGARYAVEIRNALPGRLLAVTSVDGVNVISGATAGWSQTGYVFDPGEDYQIAGWRKSDTEVADFTFTASPNSYAERTGRPANVGVIGIAVFRERPPVARVAEAQKAAPPAADLPATRSPTDATLAAAQADLAGATASRERAAGAPVPAAPRLGTGHGEREYSYVQDTQFQRLQSEPNEVIRIRYDSMENLVAMGVIRHSRVLPRAPDPFPVSRTRGYVPDPPG